MYIKKKLVTKRTDQKIKTEEIDKSVRNLGETKLQKIPKSRERKI